ncbi:MAG: 2Fe-2S iron-sulfur cluster-binding protein, partial [candidate division Zixibacteria bacterium]|nr:2Fe-2S iron-sulfur cluster-binding protein [candidate division Zixibacteria bacterium]
MVSLTIDDKIVEVEDGQTILEAAKKAGIDIPTFCWHPKLKILGGC